MCASRLFAAQGVHCDRSSQAAAPFLIPYAALTVHVWLQVACVLLNDTVPFRVHWPKAADLRINSLRLQTGRRNVMHALGANGRDEAVNISASAVTGMSSTMCLFGNCPAH